MTPEMKRSRADEAIHERARMLAAESVDAALEQADSEWLDGHLATCSDCAAVAQEHRAIHDELRSLAAPEVPRDLWARTSAAFDRIDAAGSRSHGAGRAVRSSNRPLISTAVAVGAVVTVAAASLLVQSPIATPAPAHSGSSAVVALGSIAPNRQSASPQTPITVVNGTSYWITADAGVYQIKSATTQCPATGGACSVTGGPGQTLGSITSDSPVSAVIAPGAIRAAVWTDNKVAIVPLTAGSQTVSLDSMTPRPTIAATPTVEPTPTPTPTPTAEVTAASEITVAPAVEATSTATATPTSETATPAPTRTPRATSVKTTAAPAATPAGSASTTQQPIVILSGYEVVGRDPQFSADGGLVAFSARPVDHSTGPNVFVWRVGQAQATPVTFHNSDMFSGWYGKQILVSEISVGQTAAATEATATASGSSDTAGCVSYVLNPDTGSVLEIARPMLLPTVDPTGQYLIYWSGTVEFDQSSGLWQPGQGDLYFDTWSDLEMIPASLGPVGTPTATASPIASETASAEVTATPTATLLPSPGAVDTATTSPEPTAVAPSPTQVAPTPTPAPQAPAQLLPAAATSGTVHSWVVRWDASGQHVAIWVADPGSASIGRLGLFSIDRTTGLVNTNEPLLGADKVMGSIAFDDGRLVYTSAVTGKTVMLDVPSVPPSKAETPSPTMPGQLPSGGAPSGSPTPPASGRPGD
jgi:hypothetical protein